MQAKSDCTPAPIPSSTYPLLSISEAADKLGVHVNTLRDWTNKGDFPCIVLPSGHRRYRVEDVNRFLGFDESTEVEAAGNVPIALVARVSTNKQASVRKGSKTGKSDLDRQIEKLEKWAAENHPDSTPTLYKRTSSGMNYDDPVFLKLIDDLLEGKYRGGLVVAVHFERVCRFGIQMVETIAKKGGAQILFIGSERDEESEETIAEDIMAVLCHYSAKHYGRRSREATFKNTSSEAIERMVELRQQNYGIKEITETLNREGFRMGTGKDESQWREKFSRHKVTKLLDSNGTEEALTMVVGFDRPEKSALDMFLDSEVERTDNGERIGTTEFRNSYEKWCASRDIQAESSNMIGTRLRERGITLKKSNGKRYIYGLKMKA